MKVIAVNISRTINTMSVTKATERAWKLNYHKASKCKHIIGVSNGIVLGYFNVISIRIDRMKPDRIRFKIKKCTNRQENQIMNVINVQNLRNFVTKYF